MVFLLYVTLLFLVMMRRLLCVFRTTYLNGPTPLLRRLVVAVASDDASVSRLCRRRCNLHAIGNINSLLDGTYFDTIVCLSVCSAVCHNATPTKCIYISLQRGKSVTTVVICVSNQKFIIQQPFRDDVLNNSERVSPFITSPNLSANMNIH
jgi:hypothetical protein